LKEKHVLQSFRQACCSASKSDEEGIAEGQPLPKTFYEDRESNEESFSLFSQEPPFQEDQGRKESAKWSDFLNRLNLQDEGSLIRRKLTDNVPLLEELDHRKKSTNEMTPAALLPMQKSRQVSQNLEDFIMTPFYSP